MGLLKIIWLLKFIIHIKILSLNLVENYKELSRNSPISHHSEMITLNI